MNRSPAQAIDKPWIRRKIWNTREMREDKNEYRYRVIRGDNVTEM